MTASCFPGGSLVAERTDEGGESTNSADTYRRRTVYPQTGMRDVTRRLTLTLIPGLLLGAATLAGPATLQLSAAAASPAIAFEVPRVADPIHTYGEPDIGLPPNQADIVPQPSDKTTGEVYVSGPTGTGTQRSIWQGSVDGGHTFRNVGRAVGQAPTNPCDVPVLGKVCGPVAAPGGGDTEIAFDHNRKQYFADLYALACQHVATRLVDNTGAEQVADSPAGGCPVPGSDRQWFLVRDRCIDLGPVHRNGCEGSPPLIYMESNVVAGAACTPGSAGWYKSSDGLTYTSAISGTLGGGASTYCPFGADGYPSIDQQSGKVFQAEYGTVGGAAAIQLNIGVPRDAAGDLCFLDHANGTYGVGPLADSCTETAAGPNENKLITIAVNDPAKNDVVNDAGEAANFVVTSLDSGRNLWVTWVNHALDPKLHQAYVAVASASSNWRTWSKPVRVSQPPSRVSIFPWVQAGDAGRADVVWYGDATSATPSSTTDKHVWDVYMSQVVFPLVNPQVRSRGAAPNGSRIVNPSSINIAATPSVTQVKVTPHPMDLTDVCLAGTACITQVGNRNLADYFQVRTDNTGAAMIVYDDMSNGYCQPIGGCPAVQGTDHAGAPVVTIARQSSGEGLFNDPVTQQPMLVTGPSNAPISGMPDAAGDALAPVFGGTNVPGLDIVDHRMSVNGQVLTISLKLAGDPRAAGVTDAAGCTSCHVQLVTRWQMGTHLYYGMYETGPVVSGDNFFAGETQTIDDCSVSACDPHILTYPEAAPFGVTGNTESGTVECPAMPSASLPCKVTIQVKLPDVGAPTATSLLEEVGAYAFVSRPPQGAITQAVERADAGATEIDGVCCYNFVASGAYLPPPVQTTPTPGNILPSTLPNTAVLAAIPPFAWAATGLVALLVSGLGVLGARRFGRGRRRS